MIDFETMLEWIKKIGGYRECDAKWVKTFIIDHTKWYEQGSGYLDYTVVDEYIDAMDNWCLIHSGEQVAALAFRIAGQYWCECLKCPSIEDLETYIKSRILPIGLSDKEQDMAAYGILAIMFYFLNALGNIVDAYGIDMRHMWQQLKLSEELMEPILDYSKNNKENISYKTMPRTHRIAAVAGLIDKMGLRKTIDGTKIAEFIEAVTGGNIETSGKDTVAYKKPTKDAQNAANELLKKIGIE